MVISVQILEQSCTAIDRYLVQKLTKMVKDIKKYIENSTENQIYVRKNILGKKYDRMYVFYCVDHLPLSKQEDKLNTLIGKFMKLYYEWYQVEFIASNINRVVIKQCNKRSNIFKLRLAQINANRILRDFIN